MNAEKIKLLAKDLTKDFPRGPREMIAGYVLAARCLDKCRAEINGSNGEYHFNCPLDNIFLGFAEINAEKLKNFVATGATDAEVADWITANARKRERIDIIQWNNKQRDLRVSDLPPEVQEYLEDYIQKFIPRNRPIYQWFDVYDIEEQRI